MKEQIITTTGADWLTFYRLWWKKKFFLSKEELTDFYLVECECHKDKAGTCICEKCGEFIETPLSHKQDDSII